MRNYISVGSWSIGENGQRVFNVDDRVSVSQSFIDSYHLDESSYPSLFESIQMPTARDAAEWISRTLIPNLKEQSVGWRKRKYEKKVDETAYEAWVFLIRQDPEKLILI